MTPGQSVRIRAGVHKGRHGMVVRDGNPSGDTPPAITVQVDGITDAAGKPARLAYQEWELRAVAVYGTGVAG